MGGLVSIVSYSRPSRRFQPGEGPSSGLLRDCTTSPINRFAALVPTALDCSVAGLCLGGLAAAVGAPVTGRGTVAAPARGL